MSINLLIDDNQKEEEKESKSVDNKSNSRLIDFVLPEKENPAPNPQPETVKEVDLSAHEAKEVLDSQNKSFWRKLFNKDKKKQEKSANQTVKSDKDKFFDFSKNTSSEPSKAPQDLPKGEPATDRVLPTESFSSANLGVSLIPEEIPITQRMIIEGALKLIAFVLIGILLVFFGRLYAIHKYEIAKENIVRMQNDISTYDAQINALLPAREQIINLQSKAQRVESLLKNHIYWTNLFDKLEKYTMPDIYWGDFGADTSGKISLTATGKDLISAARQLVAFSNAPDFIKSVSIGGIHGGTFGVSFTASLELVPNFFNK